MLKRVLVTSAVAACVAGAGVSLAPTVAAAQKGAQMYILTNLHADGKHMLLYSANYLNPTPMDLIPACTEVKEVSRSKSKMVFTIAGSGKKYTYELNAPSTPEGFDANITKYFGSSCDQGAGAGMSSVDQQGIKEGRAIVGMSKKAVIMAIGYPPTSRTANTDGNEWRYWHNKFKTMLVTFEGGKVKEIKE